MTREEILKRTKEIIIRIDPNKKDAILKATEESNLRTDLGLNSIGLLYIVISIEKEFNIEFNDISYGEFEKVGNVIDYIQKETKLWKTSTSLLVTAEWI